MADDGDVDTTLCWRGPVHVVNAGASDRFGNCVVDGGVRSALPQAMDALRVECLGSFETHASDFRHKGYCVFKDASGDAIFSTDARSPEAGQVWRSLGGTGKFEGMTGGGMVEVVAGPAAETAATIAGCRRLVGRYQVYPLP